MSSTELPSDHHKLKQEVTERQQPETQDSRNKTYQTGATGTSQPTMKDRRDMERMARELLRRQTQEAPTSAGTSDIFSAMTQLGRGMDWSKFETCPDSTAPANFSTWMAWKRKFLGRLNTCRLANYLTVNEPPYMLQADTGEVKLVKKTKLVVVQEKDAMIWSIFLTVLPPRIMQLIQSYEDMQLGRAREGWCTLVHAFEGNTSTGHLYSFLSQMLSMKQREDEPIIPWIQRLGDIIRAIEETKASWRDVWVLLSLRGATDTYQPLVDQLLAQKNIDIDTVRDRGVSFENSKGITHRNTKESHAFNTDDDKTPKETPGEETPQTSTRSCFNCKGRQCPGRFGYWKCTKKLIPEYQARQDRFIQRRRQQGRVKQQSKPNEGEEKTPDTRTDNSSAANSICVFARTVSNISSSQAHAARSRSQNQSNADPAQLPPGTELICDTGSQHMFLADTASIRPYLRTDDKLLVEVANGRQDPTRGSTDCTAKIKNEVDGTTMNLNIRDGHVIPGSKQNLFSVGQMCESGYVGVFSTKGVYFAKEGNVNIQNVILQGKYHNRKWWFTTEPTAEATTDTSAPSKPFS